MISEQALAEAIAECQGQRSPNRDTCMILAACYIIQDHMYGTKSVPDPVYSYAPAPEEPTENLVSYDSGSEFSQAIQGMTIDRVLEVMDETMDAVKIVQPRLYAGVLRKLSDE